MLSMFLEKIVVIILLSVFKLYDLTTEVAGVEKVNELVIRSLIQGDFMCLLARTELDRI